MFLNTAVVNGRRARFSEFEADAIVQSLSGSINIDRNLFILRMDGKVLSDTKIPNTHIVILGNSFVALKLLDQMTTKE